MDSWSVGDVAGLTGGACLITLRMSDHAPMIVGLPTETQSRGSLMRWLGEFRSARADIANMKDESSPDNSKARGGLAATA